MLGNSTGWHFLIIRAIVLLLCGATEPPALARSVGQSMKIFTSEIKTARADDVDAAEPAVSNMADTVKQSGSNGLSPTP
jgi:sec-independent protein translocase protein TatA